MSLVVRAGGRDKRQRTNQTVCDSGSPMNLMNLPYDVLAPIIGNLGFKDQMSFRLSCKRSRDLTTGAALANRLAHVIFFEPPIGMRGVHMIFLSIIHPGDLGVVLSRCSHSPLDKENYLRRWEDPKRRESFPDWEDRSATIHCTGIEDSRRLVVKVFLHFRTYVKTADTSRTGKGEWENDKVTLRFEVTAEGGVEGIAVVFREGFAEKRAAIVGELLAEVLKNAAAATAAASLSTGAFENCDDASRAKVATQALAQLKRRKHSL